MEEGDLVTYEPISGNRFFFEVVDTSNRTSSKIESFNYGIVQYDKSIKQYYVEEDINKRPLKIDYVPQRFMISDRDEKVFGLQMGDIVDLSWYEGNFSKGKVNWKHRTEDLPDKEETVSSKIKNHSSSKETSPKESVDPLLQGKIITLIGLEPYWAKYKQLVEERGGTLWTHSSTDHKVSRTASIRKSDLVIVGISHTSHDASQHAAKKAKEKKTRFASMDGYGGTTFLMTVYDKLNIKDAIA